jgi:hypothetical protein
MNEQNGNWRERFEQVERTEIEQQERMAPARARQVAILDLYGRILRARGDELSWEVLEEINDVQVLRELLFRALGDVIFESREEFERITAERVPGFDSIEEVL